MMVTVSDSDKTWHFSNSIKSVIIYNFLVNKDYIGVFIYYVLGSLFFKGEKLARHY